jgi:multisubunit Na+/H+ antiporter MnhE subunit
MLFFDDENRNIQAVIIIYIVLMIVYVWIDGEFDRITSGFGRVWTKCVCFTFRRVKINFNLKLWFWAFASMIDFLPWTWPGIDLFELIC